MSKRRPLPPRAPSLRLEESAPIDPYDPARRDKWVYRAEDIRVIMPGLNLPPVEEAMTDTLYDTDFHAWAQQQARALQAKEWAALDLNHLIEEVEDLAGRHRDALGSELKRLLVHLLKWHYQATHRSDSWVESIEQGRQAIDEVIEDHPSLADYPPIVLPKAYQRARRQVARETKLPLATFPPERCPWDLDDIRREGWLPLGPG